MFLATLDKVKRLVWTKIYASRCLECINYCLKCVSLKFNHSLLMLNEQERFVFEGYQIDEKNSSLIFNYAMEKQEETINFQEKIFFPEIGFCPKAVPEELLKRILENLLLAIGINYWKAFCPSNISLGDVSLSEAQAEFWNKFYSDGMGEFYYQNKMDPNGLVKFPFDAEKKEFPKIDFERKNRSLVLFGGGRDSIVTAEFLKKAGKDFVLAFVNEDDVKKNTSVLVGKETLAIERKIDQKLIELGRQNKVFKGHVPISLIWGFIYSFVAIVYDFKYIVTSNEGSSNFGNVEYRGKIINHQWSKSWEAEKLFNNYVKNFISPDITYFSLLRPFSEIKITELFLKHEKYLSSFSSCNANFKMEGKLRDSLWCGHCPKCVFVFTLISAFLSKEQLIAIFGKNLYEDEKLLPVFSEILGISGIKPFECVGTPDEMRLAFTMASEKDDYKNDKIIKHFQKNLLTDFEKEKLQKELFSFSDEHSIPEEFKNSIQQNL